MAAVGRSDAELIARYLKEAQELRDLARFLSLNKDRDIALKMAVKYEEMAAALQERSRPPLEDRPRPDPGPDAAAATLAALELSTQVRQTRRALFVEWTNDRAQQPVQRPRVDVLRRSYMSESYLRKHAFECMRLAADCEQLASDVRNPKLQSHFLRMAEVWPALAVQGPSGDISVN